MPKPCQVTAQTVAKPAVQNFSAAGSILLAKQEKFVLPEAIPKELWQAFEEIRRRRKKPLTDRARAMAVAKLLHLRDEGYDVRTVMEQSILHAWDTFYPLKAANPVAKLQDANPWDGMI